MPAKKTSPKKGKTKAKSASRLTGEEKAGIVFPTGRCTRLLRSKVPVDRISYNAGVALASALEYLCAEILEAAGDVARESGFKRIKPRHI